MTWAFVQNMSNSWEDYQRVSSEVGEEVPAGLIVHVAGPHNGGVRIIDVWESEEAHAKFAQERLMPAVSRAMGEQGPPQPPAMETLDVQHTMKP